MPKKQSSSRGCQEAVVSVPATIMTQQQLPQAQNLSIPKLTGKNYLNWRSIMCDIIVLRGYEGVVFQGYDDPVLNLQAKLLLRGALDETHLAEMGSYERAHGIWSHLSRMCIGANSSDVAMLVRKFYSFEHVPGGTMVAHLEKLTTMREQLKNVDRIQLMTFPSTEFSRRSQVNLISSRLTGGSICTGVRRLFLTSCEL